ncbi:response regulator [Rhodospirillales bacterium]|nr:response regulator [Rhodospirillales bacterium]
MSDQANNTSSSDLYVHVIDDNEPNRELFQDLLDTVELPWRSFDSAIAFLDDMDVAAIGCLILDVRMPKMSGLQLMERLFEDGIDVPIILATAHGDVPMAIQAMKQGAFDFHEKPINNQALLESVQRGLELRNNQLQDVGRTKEVKAAFDNLTPRERDVYGLVADGAMNKQIAYELDISQRTVEVHRAKVMEKMGARNLADLIKMHISLQSEES